MANLDPSAVPVGECSNSRQCHGAKIIVWFLRQWPLACFMSYRMLRYFCNVQCCVVRMFFWKLSNVTVLYPLKIWSLRYLVGKWQWDSIVGFIVGSFGTYQLGSRSSTRTELCHTCCHRIWSHTIHHYTSEYSSHCINLYYSTFIFHLYEDLCYMSSPICVQFSHHLGTRRWMSSLRSRRLRPPSPCGSSSRRVKKGFLFREPWWKHQLVDDFDFLGNLGVIITVYDFLLIIVIL